RKQTRVAFLRTGVSEGCCLRGERGRTGSALATSARSEREGGTPCQRPAPSPGLRRDLSPHGGEVRFLGGLQTEERNFGGDEEAVRRTPVAGPGIYVDPHAFVPI